MDKTKHFKNYEVDGFGVKAIGMVKTMPIRTTVDGDKRIVDVLLPPDETERQSAVTRINLSTAVDTMIQVRRKRYQDHTRYEVGKMFMISRLSDDVDLVTNVFDLTREVKTPRRFRKDKIEKFPISLLEIDTIETAYASFVNSLFEYHQALSDVGAAHVDETLETSLATKASVALGAQRNVKKILSRYLQQLDVD